MPAELSIAPLGALAALVSEKVTRRKDANRPYVGLEDMRSGSAELMSYSPSYISVSTNSLFEKGDVLFGKLRPNLRKSVIAPFSGYCSTDILVLHPRPGADPRYVGHLFRSETVTSAAVRTAIGTKMPRTSWADLEDVRVFAPQIEEQQAITEILDTIDKAIRSTEQLIAKLQQMRLGLLRDLLARGIDKNGELRDSELHPEQFKESLLGKIPCEWQVRRLGDVILSAVDGPFGSNLKTAHYVESPEVRVVRLQNIGSDEFIDDDRAYVSASHAKSLQKHDVRAGDLLVASMGDDQHPIARACLYPEYLAPGIVKADCFRLRADPGAALNGFISLVLGCPWTRSELQRLAQGVTRDRVNLRNLMEFRLALPRVDEQAAAVMRVLSLKLRTAAEHDALAKLRSIKLGLMEDLLTGRIRVTALIEGAPA